MADNAIENNFLGPLELGFKVMDIAVGVAAALSEEGLQGTPREIAEIVAKRLGCDVDSVEAFITHLKQSGSIHVVGHRGGEEIIAWVKEKAADAADGVKKALAEDAERKKILNDNPLKDVDVNQVYIEAGSVEEFRDILIGYHERKGPLTPENRKELEEKYEHRHWVIQLGGVADQRRELDERGAKRALSLEEFVKEGLAKADPEEIKTLRDLELFKKDLKFEYAYLRSPVPELLDVLAVIPGFGAAKGAAKAAKAAKAVKAAKGAAKGAGKAAGKAVGKAPKPNKAPLPDKPKPAKVEGKKPDGLEAQQKKELLPGEGEVGEYGKFGGKEKVGDNLAAHHIPNDKYMEGKGVKRKDGIAILVEEPFPGKGGRHREIHKNGFKKQDPDLSPRDALAQGIQKAREVYKKDGLGDEIRPCFHRSCQKEQGKISGIIFKEGEKLE